MDNYKGRIFAKGTLAYKIVGKGAFLEVIAVWISIKGLGNAHIRIYEMLFLMLGQKHLN